MTLLVGNPHPEDSTFCLLLLVVAQTKSIEILLLRLSTPYLMGRILRPNSWEYASRLLRLL